VLFAYAPTSATTGYVYLVDDAGDGGYVGGSPMYLPSSGTLANSQCTINGSGSSVTASGNILTITLDITFTSAFVGNQLIYTAARSKTRNSGWQPLGTRNIPGPTTPTGPAVFGMMPAVSTANKADYLLTFTDTYSYQDLYVLDVLINSTLDGSHACYFAYAPSNPSAGYLYLVSDAGDGGYAPGTPAAVPGVVLKNSQCAVQVNSAYASGDVLSLNLSLTFNSPGFSGNHAVYAAARNSSTGNSGWQAIGTITVP